MKFHIASVFADYPIFLLPLFLLVVYFFYGVVRKQAHTKRGALISFAAAVAATAINLCIQYFIDKARPETALTNAGHLVMKHLPTRSFPSDHAAVAMAVALAALTWGYTQKKKNVIIRGRILFAGAILMSVARVAVGVHRPTDILAGWGVGIVAVSLIFCRPVQYFLTNYIFRYIIQAEEWVMKKMRIN